MPRTTVAVRLDPEQVEAIRHIAEREGTDPSGWLRRVAAEGLARDATSAGTSASASDPVALMDGRRRRTFNEKVAVAQVLAGTFMRELAYESDMAGDDPTEALVSVALFRTYATDMMAAVENLGAAAEAMRKAQAERAE